MRRLLLISYFFPPLGGIGVQRPLRFARYLPECGWDVTVLVPARPTYHVRDDGLLRADEPFEVVRTPILDIPQGSFRGRHFLARNLRPDEHAGWIPFAAPVARRLALNADAIMSTSAPMSAHYIARSAARATGRPWVADFRDPYAANAYDARSHEAGKHAVQDSVLRTADAVTVAWDGMVPMFSAARGRVTVVMNGYDPDDFTGLTRRESDGTIRLVHVGSLYGVRSPQPLFEALRRAAAADPDVVRRIRVRLVGRVDRTFMEAAADLGPMIEQVGFVPRPEALREMVSADVLLLLFPGQAEAAEFVPGKLAEYWASRRHVLGFVQPGEARRLLVDSGGATVFGHSDIEGAASFIRRLAASGAAGLPVVDSSVADRYSAPVLTRQLAAVLDSVSGGG